MAASILILALLPYLDRAPGRSARHRPAKRLLTGLFFLDVILLGYVGSKPPLGAMLTVGRLGTVAYFAYFAAFLFLPWIEKARTPGSGMKA